MTARLAVALDTTSVATAQQWAEAVAEQADILKLGLEFYLANGRAGVGDVRRAAPGCGLFLDLKLHDIPATVAGDSAFPFVDGEEVTVQIDGDGIRVCRREEE